MKKLTEAQTRTVLRAVAHWEPDLKRYLDELYALDLYDDFTSNLRDEIAIMLAPALGLDEETAMIRMQAARMTD